MTASIATTVRTRFNSQFPVLRPGVPIAVAGFPFDPETEGRDANKNPIAWVRLSLHPTRKYPNAIGASAPDRNEGFVWIECYGPVGQPGLVEAIAQDAGSVFAKQTIGGVTFRSAEPRYPPDEDNWIRRDVHIDYVSDETS